MTHFSFLIIALCQSSATGGSTTNTHRRFLQASHTVIFHCMVSTARLANNERVSRGSLLTLGACLATGQAKQRVAARLICEQLLMWKRAHTNNHTLPADQYTRTYIYIYSKAALTNEAGSLVSVFQAKQPHEQTNTLDGRQKSPRFLVSSFHLISSHLISSVHLNQCRSSA